MIFRGVFESQRKFKWKEKHFSANGVLEQNKYSSNSQLLHGAVPQDGALELEGASHVIRPAAERDWTIEHSNGTENRFLPQAILFVSSQ